MSLSFLIGEYETQEESLRALEGTKWKQPKEAGPFEAVNDKAWSTRLRLLAFIEASIASRATLADEADVKANSSQLCGCFSDDSALAVG